MGEEKLNLSELTGKVIVLGRCTGKTAEYLRILKLAREQGYTVITSGEAQEAGLNIPAEILPDHGITITNAESIMPIKSIDIPELPISGEFLIKSKRGKGKHKKTYEPPYHFHR